MFDHELARGEKWGDKRLIKEFPNKRWSLKSVYLLLNEIDNFGIT